VRIKFIYTKWTKIDWANSNDGAAYIECDSSISRFIFSILVFPREGYPKIKDFKIKFESLSKNQDSSWKIISIEATLKRNYERMVLVSKDIHEVFLKIKDFAFNDGYSFENNDFLSENMERKKICITINDENLNTQFFSDVNIKIQVIVKKSNPQLVDDPLGASYPRVNASYLPISNDTSWARDRLELKLKAESRNSYFKIDAIEKIINISNGMMQQNVFEILPYMPNENYGLLALPIKNNLPVSPLTINCLSGVLSFIGANANFYNLSNLSESEITSHTSENIKNNTALMCQFLGTLRAGLMTLALAKGKLIKMYPRIDNEINNNVRIHLVDPTINYRTQNINGIILAGTGQPRATISIFANKTKSVGNAEVDSNGCWEYKDLILRNGTYTFFCNQICFNGHVRKSNSVTIPINYPVIDPKIHPLGYVTNDNCPIISGTGEPGATISISANGQMLEGDTTVKEDGSWEFKNESFFLNDYYKFQARQDCIRASKKSNVISTQILVLPDPPSAIKKAFDESEYIDDVVLIKASVRYILGSFQIGTVGKFLEDSIETAKVIGIKNYINIIEMLECEANNRQILQNNISYKLD